MNALPLSVLLALPGFRFTTISGPANISLDESAGSGVLRTDSRLCQPGDLFVALVGTRHDAHEHVDELQANGVTCVVNRSWHLSRDESDRQREGRVIVEDTQDWLPRAVCRLCGLDQATLRVTGITGTNGKSSTAWILQQLLNEQGRPAGLVGTLGNRVGQAEPEMTGLTTPDPVSLGRFARRVIDSGGDRLVMEVSSHAISQQREAVLSFSCGVFLNLSPEHLDYHGDMEAYYRTKASFMRRPEMELRLINCDTPWGVRLTEDLGPLAFQTVGRSPEAQWRITDEGSTASGQRYLLTGQGKRLEVEIPLAGSFNVDNSAAAVIVALHEGLAESQVLERLKQIEAVPGRLEPVELSGGPRVLIDYAHSPDGYQRVLPDVKASTPGRLHVLFGCGGDRDRSKRSVMVELAAENADHLWLCLDNPRSEDPEQIFADMLEGNPPRDRLSRIDDRAEAIAAALSACEAGDTLLLLGKGHERYQIIGRDRQPFDEREILKVAWQRIEEDHA